MKITQTFAFEVDYDAFDVDQVTIAESYNSLTVSLSREQAEELLAALQEALGRGVRGSYGVHMPPDSDGEWEPNPEYIPGPSSVSPDEAIARMQVGANEPDKTGRTGMPPGFRGSSSIGSGHPSG